MKTLNPNIEILNKSKGFNEQNSKQFKTFEFRIVILFRI